MLQILHKQTVLSYLLGVACLSYLLPLQSSANDCDNLHKLIQQGRVYEFAQRLQEYSKSSTLEGTQKGPFSKMRKILFKNKSPTLSECLTTPDASGNLILHRLATLGWIDSAKEVWLLSPTLNIPNQEGWTPIALAIKNGQLRMARGLHAAGADLNLSDKSAPSARNIAGRELDFSLLKEDWKLRNPDRTPQLESILNHLGQKELLEAVIETEILFDLGMTPQQMTELQAWYKNLETLGKNEWNTSERDFPLGEYIQFLKLRTSSSQMNLIQLIDLMDSYSLRRYKILFQEIVETNLLARAAELKSPRDFRELHQMIECFYKTAPLQKKMRENLRPLLARQFIALGFEMLKGNPIFEEILIAPPVTQPPAHGQESAANTDEVDNSAETSTTAQLSPTNKPSKCAICLESEDESNPLAKSACGQCYLHPDCQGASTEHFIKNFGVLQAKCPSCNRGLGINNLLSEHLPSEYEIRLKGIALTRFGEQIIQKEKTWETCKTLECPGIWSFQEKGKNGAVPEILDSASNGAHCFVCEEEIGEEKMGRINRAKEENSSEKFIKKLLNSREFKRCPKCEWIISKNGGCDHMTCKKCHHEFYWSTLKNYR